MASFSKKEKFGYLLFAIVISFVFLLLFSYSTSPLFPKITGYDSSFYQLVGMGMTKGLMPYRDFFEIKGPVMFFIQYLGQVISFGRGGIFLLQIINLTIINVSLVGIAKILKPELKHWHIISIIVISLIFLFTVFDEGNLTEEYSLTFNMICIYLFLKKLKVSQDEQFLLSFMLGLSFGAVALIRITNAIIICVIELMLLFDYLSKKQYQQLFKNVLYCSLGLLTVVIPICIYFSYNGLLKEMIECAFLFATKYATEEIGIKIRWLFILPLLLFYCNKSMIQNKKNFAFYTLMLLGNCFILTLGNNYLHYYIMLYPLYGIMLIAVFNLKKNYLVLGLGVIIAVNIMSAYLPLTYFYDRLFNPDNSMIANHNNSLEIGNLIDKKLPVFSYNANSNFYYDNNIYPSHKYSFWQNHFIELEPEIKNELLNYINSKKAIYFVIGEEDKPNTEIMNAIHNNYQLVLENESYILMKRK